MLANDRGNESVTRSEMSLTREFVRQLLERLLRCIIVASLDTCRRYAPSRLACFDGQPGDVSSHCEQDADADVGSVSPLEYDVERFVTT